MHPTETNTIIYSAELNPLDCSKRFTPGRLVHSDTNATSLRSNQLRCILRKDYLQTFTPLYIATYSFMYMSELGHRGENENAQTLKQQQRGFETKLSQLRVQYSTAELLHSTAELLHSTAELLHYTAELLQSTAEQLQSTAEQLHSTAELLHPTAELLHSTEEQLHSTAEQLHSTAEQLHSTAALLHSTAALLHSTAELLHYTVELLHYTGEPLRCASKQCGRGMTLTIKLFMQCFPTFLST